MQEDSFVEKFKASLGDKSLAFSNTLSKIFSKEEEIKIVDGPKLKIDKEDYELMAVSWKELGASQEREELRYILTQILVLAERYKDKSFVDGINFVLKELEDRERKSQGNE
jgi:hypothetical protein